MAMIAIRVRCVDYFSHSLLLVQVCAGWISSRALLQQPDFAENRPWWRA